MTNEYINKIINNKEIQKIIKDLNLNQKQIESGYEIFKTIIEEIENISNYEYITKVKIYDNENIIGISVLNPDASILIKKKRLHWLNWITPISSKLSFSIPNAIMNNKKVDELKFYWTHETFKNNDRTNLASWIKNYYKNFIKGEYTKGIYIYGPSGAGKTFFLICLANYSINKNKSTIFVSTLDLLEFLLKNIDKNSDLNYESINQLKEVDLLIIDDLGSEKQSNWFLYSILFPILDYRLKTKKTTCFSSNYSLLELKKIWKKSKEIDYIKVDKLIEKISNLSNEVILKKEEEFNNMLK